MSEEPTTDAAADGGQQDGGQTVVRRDRFSGGPARGFLSSMDADDRIFEADLAVDRSHAVMLAEQGIVPEDDIGAILVALDDVEEAGFDALPAGEDVHEAIESAVIERVGPAGGKMHTARSRNDEVATCIRYRLREDLLDAVEAVNLLRETLLAVADEHTETVMPGYTHLQPAQPTTVAHYLCSYEGQLSRDAARLLDAYARTNESPLGAAAFAGTPFDVDRERTAELLGFDGVVENSMDASSARDFLYEGVAALAGVATTLSGLAEDLVVFSNKGLVELDDDYASTSSIMPQKKNPDTMELVRSVAGDAAGGLQGLLTTLKGLPRAYNRDLQNATTHAWETVDAVVEATEVAAGAVGTAHWPEEALADAAGEGFSTATGVADLLAMHGVPFRTAHEVVAQAAKAAERTSGETASDAGEADYEALDAAAREHLGESLDEAVGEDAVKAALDPAHSVAMRDSRGGPAPEAAEATLASATEDLEHDRTLVGDARDALAAAEDELAAEVADYV
ncbi:argininosuccinate lyase [Halospeciosus flavus]|uniref:Argininosuccinate lyase n=1 Tax=Halospeciosus flavus TaxID=3032283 RepID=A0ABD5Z7A5_9EURY|nr:argininosuccinate lyase [Halospeciosus flavus]